ncbi:MAG: hypothetical protein HYY76_19750 [Acidobacteria bacterium]|nr:hypothetical protein [Acidobacteriota bacterium]
MPLTNDQLEYLAERIRQINKFTALIVRIHPGCTALTDAIFTYTGEMFMALSDDVLTRGIAHQSVRPGPH